MTRDPRDPVKPFAAAAMMGVLLARGLATEAEVAEALLTAAIAIAPRRCRIGMRVRLVHALRDAAAEAARERETAACAVSRVTAALDALWAAMEGGDAAEHATAREGAIADRAPRPPRAPRSSGRTGRSPAPRIDDFS